MSERLPKLDKTVISVTSLHDEAKDKDYWLKKSPSERLEAIEIQRRLVYGEKRTTARIRWVIEVLDLSKS
ncbi:MAG: hypothetical protein MRJ65_06565 [Candidatus Brocadiaceae bacterium]|nr:hypothetical protein [Candidatus Brocadiaceae bacterium]